MKEDILVYPINYQSRTDVIKIKPLMDLHKGAKTCDLQSFRTFIKDIDEYTYFITCGDLWDMIFFDDPRYRPSGNDDDRSDEAIDDAIDEMVDLLSPIKDRIICIGTGNHEDTVTKRCKTNPSKRLATALNIPYLGYSYWFRLMLRSNGAMARSVDFFVSHGFGGGTRTEGGSITKYSRFADRFLSDVFITGHDHKKQYVRYPVLAITGDKYVKLTSQPKLVCLGGSWKKTFSVGTDVTWEETKGFNPVEIGGMTINIKPAIRGIKLSVSM